MFRMPNVQVEWVRTSLVTFFKDFIIEFKQKLSE